MPLQAAYSLVIVRDKSEPSYSDVFLAEFR
jgi:hypothetical protein